MQFSPSLSLAALVWVSASALDAPTIYNIDPDRTHPRYEAAFVDFAHGAPKTVSGHLTPDFSSQQYSGSRPCHARARHEKRQALKCHCDPRRLSLQWSA